MGALPVAKVATTADVATSMTIKPPAECTAYAALPS